MYVKYQHAQYPNSQSQNQIPKGSNPITFQQIYSTQNVGIKPSHSSLVSKTFNSDQLAASQQIIKGRSIQQQPISIQHQNSNGAQVRNYHSVKHGQSGDRRKGQQAMQSSILHRHNPSSTPQSDPHIINMNGRVTPQMHQGTPIQLSQSVQNNLIKSYDSTGAQQRVSGSLSIVGANGAANFNSLNNSVQIQGPIRGDSSLVMSGSQSTVSRKGQIANQTAISLRAKNNSVNGHAPGIQSYLMGIQQTPQTMQGYSTQVHDSEQRLGHRRTGSKVNMNERQTPQKSRDNQLQQKQYNSQGPAQKLIDQRSKVNQSQQITALTSSTNQKQNSIVSQSLDSSLQVHLHKRKTSNDEGRYKNSRISQHNNVIAPFLDQSLDFSSVGIQQLTGGLQGQSKQMLKDKTNTTNNITSTSVTQEINRPKTSTGLRVAPVQNKIADEPQSTNNLQLQTQVHLTSVLPTKQSTSKNQSTLTSKAEKNDALRQQLRRSFDASAQGQKNQQNNGPVSRDQMFQPRPHSSTKIHNQIVKSSISSTHAGQIQNLINQLPTNNPNDRYEARQRESREQNSNSLPSKSDQTNERQKRKRDFSKVIDFAAKALNTSATISHENSSGIGFANSGLDIQPQTVQSNSFQNQFNTLQPQSEQQQITSQSKLINKIQKKSHLRSLTSHKMPQQKPNISMQVLRKDDVSIGTNAVTNASPGINSKLNSNFTTIDQSEEDRKPERSLIQQSKEKPERDGSMRASITREVTTAKEQNDWKKSSNAPKKFDNCVTKFSFATKTGFSPKNPNKINQDSYLVLPHLGEYRRTHFFAVADGHGVFGKEVSEFVKSQLGFYVEQSIKNTFDQAKIAQRVVDSTEVKEQLTRSFVQVQNTLVSDSKINLRFSGSTCVSVLIVGTKVFCANVGDSRAVLVRSVGPNDQLTAIPLNRDHKADEPDEEARIIRNGGRVQPYRDMHGNPLGPLRVWHLKEDIPGLAMTRSFGDQAAAQVGVIASPEILEMNLLEGDHFIILASDGVWEFISNEEAAKIIMPHYKNNSAEKAAEAIIKESIKRWQEEDTSIDDITCIIIFLNIQ